MSNQIAPTPGFSIVRVLISLAVIAAIGGGGYALYTKLMTDPGTLYEATGEVIWNGEPVTIGAVMTQHDNDPMLCTIGPLDENGHFTLLTNMEPGAAVGRHKLIVASFGNGMPPPPLVPQHYTSYEDTPFYIDVTADPQKNHFIITLEGDLPPQRGRPGPPNDEPVLEDVGSAPDATEAEASDGETTSE